MALGIVVPAQGNPQRHCPRFLDSRLRGNDEGGLKPVTTALTGPIPAIRVSAPMTSLTSNIHPFMPFVLFMVSEFSCFLCGLVLGSHSTSTTPAYEPDQAPPLRYSV